MNESHITNILDNSSLRNLPEHDLQTIRAHVETCTACRRAYRAAQISAVLVETRAQEAAEKAIEANPFFHTRVLAALREQQALANVSAIRRLWNATGALVASMAATVAALAVLTLAVPSSEPASQQTAALVPYSAEAVVLDQDQDQDNNQLTDDQTLSAIYADDDEGK
jgi:hypothetical protein